MTSSTVSSESAPRSSTNDDSFLISASFTPSCSATIFLTRCSTFSMLLLPSRDQNAQRPVILPDGMHLPNAAVNVYAGRAVQFFAYCIYMPPLTCNVVPVTYPASDEARNATAFATSCGDPSLPSGMRSSNFVRCASSRDRVISVSMKPGATQFTVISRLPTSCAKDLVNPTRAAFAAE